MKNGLVVLNVILLIAVGVLFYLHFGSAKTTKTTDTKRGSNDTASTYTHGAGSKIAYFEMDSIDNGFNMVKDVKDELSKQDESNQRIVNDLDKSYEKRYNELGNSAKTPEQVEAARQELLQLQSDINKQKQDMLEKKNNLQFQRIQDIQKTIEEYLKDFNKDKGYNFIFSYERGLIYYRDTMYNITSEILRGLNDMYKKKKEEKKVSK